MVATTGWRHFQVIQLDVTSPMSREAVLASVAFPLQREKVMFQLNPDPSIISVVAQDADKFVNIIGRAGFEGRVVDVTEEIDARAAEGLTDEPAEPATFAPDPPRGEGIYRMTPMRPGYEPSRRGLDRQTSAQDDKLIATKVEFPEELRVVRRGWYVDRVGHMLSRRQIREAVGKIAVPRFSGMGVRTDGSSAYPSDIHQKLGTAPARNEAFRTAEEHVRGRVAALKHPTDTASQMASVMIRNTGAYVQSVKNRITELSKDYLRRQECLCKEIGFYQAGKYVQERFREIAQYAGAANGQKKRKGVFHAYAKLFGGDAGQMEHDFQVRISEMLSSGGLGGTTEQVKVWVKEMVVLDSELVSAKALLDVTLTDRREVLLKQVTEQLAVISGFQFVDKVWFSSDTLFVNVGAVVIGYQQKSYNLGGYTLSIDLSGEASKADTLILIRSLEYSSNENQHPHADRTSVCWGNIKEGIIKLYAQWDFPMLINLLWNFLHAYNPGDCYQSLAGLFKDVGRQPTPDLGGQNAKV